MIVEAKIIKTLFEDIFSIEEARILANDLDNLQNLLYTNYSDVAKMIENDVNSSLRTKIKRLIDIDSKDIVNELSELIRITKSIISDSKVFNLTVAIQPKGKLQRSVTQWLRQQTSKLVFVNFVFNPEIFGGVLIEFDGQFRDYSLTKLFNV